MLQHEYEMIHFDDLNLYETYLKDFLMVSDVSIGIL